MREARRLTLHGSGRVLSVRPLLWLAALALCACASGAAGGRPGQGIRFAGPGQLLVVFEHAGVRRELVLVQAGGARRVEMPRFREARFAGPDLLVLALEARSRDDDYGPPATQLALHDLATGATRRFGPVADHYDLEPSPDGLYLAVGVERGEVGEAELEIWSLGSEPELLASRPQALEEPRWREGEDGRPSALAVALLMPDPEGDAGGGGFGESSFSWPRLHRLRRDLGEPALIFDGTGGPGDLAPGGSLPLWWDARGLFARQNEGLMRCDPEQGGCTRVFGSPLGRRIVGGRPVGPREAWLLTVLAQDAFDRGEPDEIVRVELETGAALSRWRAPPGVAVVDLDWQAP
jgi:hypothetical protein